MMFTSRIETSDRNVSVTYVRWPEKSTGSFLIELRLGDHDLIFEVSERDMELIRDVADAALAERNRIRAFGRAA